jgi:membrane associated rhomboid family serine protease
MRWLTALERKFGRHAGIPHLGVVLAVGQGLAAMVILAQPELVEKFVLVPKLVTAYHEYWRLLTFLFFPPTLNPLFLFFAIMFLWMMGNALELAWGTFRFNVFMLIGYLATIGAAFLVPGGLGVATNLYLMGSIFLAFAVLNPDYRILIFFILPVPVKWLALLEVFLYAAAFFQGDWYARAAIAAALLNFFLFLTPDLIDYLRTMRMKGKQKRRRMATVAPVATALHTCVICGRTEKTDPQLEFRYCDRCAGSRCYCEEHLRTHVHIMPTDAGSPI